MRRLSSLCLLILAVLAAGCTSSGTGSKKTVAANITPTSIPAPATSAPAPTSPPATPRIVLSSSFATFLSTICHALASRDVNVLTSALPYYEYNSGLRYGMLGDGEGQTGAPSLIGTWLQNASTRCRYFTPDQAGHATLLTSGWTQPGPWGLIEMDTFNGAWKINDFTFGAQAALWQAMQTSQPVLPYARQ